MDKVRIYFLLIRLFFRRNSPRYIKSSSKYSLLHSYYIRHELAHVQISPLNDLALTIIRKKVQNGTPTSSLDATLHFRSAKKLGAEDIFLFNIHHFSNYTIAVKLDWFVKHIKICTLILMLEKGFPINNQIFF